MKHPAKQGYKFTKSVEGSDDSLQTLLQYMNGEIDEFTTTNSMKTGGREETYPAYTPAKAMRYVDALKNSDLVASENVELLPPLIRAFAARDLVDCPLFDKYLRHDVRLPRTNLQKLAQSYDEGLSRADAFFSSFGYASCCRPKADNSTKRGLHACDL